MPLPKGRPNRDLPSHCSVCGLPFGDRRPDGSIVDRQQTGSTESCSPQPRKSGEDTQRYRPECGRCRRITEGGIDGDAYASAQERVRQRDECGARGRCAICGVEMPVKLFERGHIISKKMRAQRPDLEHFWLPICADCNGSQGERPGWAIEGQPEWVAMSEIVRQLWEHGEPAAQQLKFDDE